MKRLAVAGGLVVGVLVTLVILSDLPRIVSQAQAQFAQAVRIMDGAHVQLAAVSHIGALRVQCFDAAGAAESCGNAGIGGVTPVYQSGSWTVQATHQAGEWNIRHLGALMHVVIVDWQRWAHREAGS